MASNAILFKCLNSFGSCKNLITSRLSNPIYQQIATLRQATKNKLESLKIPDQPKRPLTPYFRFLANHRAVVRQAHPDWKVIEITKQCSQDWHNIEPNIKEKFQSEYAKDLEVYAVKQNEYTSALTPEQIEALKLARREKRESKVKRAIKQRFRETSKPKRPLGSFLYFIKDKWLLPENKTKKLPELLQGYKGDWNTLPDLQKEKYIAQHIADRQRYEKEMLEWEAKMVKEGNSDIIRKDSQIVTKAKSEKVKKTMPEKPAKPKVESKKPKKKSD